MFVNCSLQDLYINNSDEILKPGECRKEIPQLLSVNTEVCCGGYDSGKYKIRSMYIILNLKLYEIGIIERAGISTKWYKKSGCAYDNRNPIYPELSEATFCIIKFRENIIFTERESTLVIVEHCCKLKYMHRKKDRIIFNEYKIKFDDGKVRQIPNHTITSTPLDFGAVHIMIEKNEDPRIKELLERIRVLEAASK